MTLTNLIHHPAAGMVKEDSAEELDGRVNGEDSSWQAEEPSLVNGWQQKASEQLLRITAL